MKAVSWQRMYAHKGCKPNEVCELVKNVADEICKLKKAELWWMLYVSYSNEGFKLWRR